MRRFAEQRGGELEFEVVAFSWWLGGFNSPRIEGGFVGLRFERSWSGGPERRGR